MSVGAAPLTDEDLRALQLPPQIVPPEPAPVEGPSPTPPDFIDQTNAQPLAAPVSGTNVDHNAFPPPVPAEAPGAVPAPPPLPGAPSLPGPAPKPGAPASPKDQLAQADQDVRTAATGAATARETADQKQLEALEGGAQQAREEHNAAIDQLANKQDEIDRTEKLQAQYDHADREAQQKIDDAAKARKNFSFRSYWADKSSATRIASALFQALGALGAGLTRGPNYALQILDKQMDDDHRDQVEQLQKLSDDEVRARTGLQDSREARKQALLGIQVNAAQGDAMIAAQFKLAAAKATDDNFKKQAEAFAAKLQQDSAQKLLEARMAVRQGIIKEQDDAAKRAEQEARAHLLNVQAEHGGFARVARGTGGGGGAASPAQGAAAATLSEMISKGAAYPDLVVKANELGYPLEAKAGHPSLKSLIAASKTQGAAGKADLGEVDKRMKAVQQEAFGPKGPGTQLERLNGMTAYLDNAIKNGDKTAATGAIEEVGGLLSGGKTTKNTVALIEELKSSKDELLSKWGHFTSDPGASAAFTKRLNGLLNTVKEEKRKELDQIRQRAVDTEMGEHGLAREGAAKERALGHLGMFNGVTNANGTARYGAGAGGGHPEGADTVDEAKIARAQAARAGGTPQQKANAEAYLKSVGRL